MPDIKCEIMESLSVLPAENGYHLELNLVKWGNNPPKYDLRRWSEDRSKMTNGIILTKEELMLLQNELLNIKL
ncbi:MAG: hypothetical protein RR446_04010 [Lachnospiraceae bacterium]